jgi:hypothetical protein
VKGRAGGFVDGPALPDFEDKLDLYRWLLTDEAPRRKREFLGAAPRARQRGDGGGGRRADACSPGGWR